MRSATVRKRSRKQSVNLSLDAKVLAQARKLTDNLSAFVEAKLVDLVQSHASARESELEVRRQAALQAKAFTEKYGSLADEFSTL